MTKMDLDSSLDDIIKHKKQKKVTVTTTKKVIKKQTEKTKKVKSIISKSNINSRLVSLLRMKRPLFTYWRLVSIL
jgi:predicted metalloenzyme YecM